MLSLKKIFPFLFPQPRPEPVSTLDDLGKDQNMIAPDQYQNLVLILKDLGIPFSEFQILGENERSRASQWGRIENGNLVALSLRNTRFRQFDQLAGFSDLAELSLENCRLEKLPELPVITSVKILYLGRNMLTNFSNIERFLALEYLSINQNRITSLDDFPEMPHLLSLNLSDNQIRVIGRFKPGNNLNSLSLTGNQLETFPLAELPDQLNYLNLNQNPLRILRPDLAEMTEEDELTLQALVKAYDKKYPVRSGSAKKSRGAIKTKTNIFASSSRITGKGSYQSIRGYYQRKLTKGMHINQIKMRISITSGILRVKLSDHSGIAIPSRPLDISGQPKESGLYEKWVVFETITPEVRGVEFELF
jgi:hypothetical protein